MDRQLFDSPYNIPKSFNANSKKKKKKGDELFYIQLHIFVQIKK